MEDDDRVKCAYQQIVACNEQVIDELANEYTDWLSIQSSTSPPTAYNDQQQQQDRSWMQRLMNSIIPYLPAVIYRHLPKFLLPTSNPPISQRIKRLSRIIFTQSSILQQYGYQSYEQFQQQWDCYKVKHNISTDCLQQLHTRLHTLLDSLDSTLCPPQPILQASQQMPLDVRVMQAFPQMEIEQKAEGTMSSSSDPTSGQLISLRQLLSRLPSSIHYVHFIMLRHFG